MKNNKILGHKDNKIYEHKNWVCVLDKFDPAYDSQEEKDYISSILDIEKLELKEKAANFVVYGRLSGDCKMNLVEFKQKINALLHDYILRYNVMDFTDSLHEINCPSYHDVLVEQAVRLAIDNSFEQQQEISALLTILSDSNNLCKEQIENALEKLIENIEDIRLDVPKITDRLDFFIACAVDDKIVSNELFYRYPQSMLQYLLEDKVDCTGIKEDVDKFECEKHSEPNFIKLQMVAMMKYKSMVLKEVDDILLNSVNLDGVCQIIEEIDRVIVEDISCTKLGACKICAKGVKKFGIKKCRCVDFSPKYFRHEIVKILIIESLNKSKRIQNSIPICLDNLYGVLFSRVDIWLGFSRLLQSIEDISLDYPAAKEIIAFYTANCIYNEILPPSFIKSQQSLYVGDQNRLAVLRRISDIINMEGQFSRLTELDEKININ